MISLRDAVKAESALKVIPEEVPLGESQANGEVEGAINMIKGQVTAIALQNHQIRQPSCGAVAS